MSYYLDNYLPKEKRQEIESLFYDYPYVDIHIQNLEQQLKELDEDIIGNPGTSVVVLSRKGSGTNDRTGTAALKLADSNHARKSIQQQIKYYNRIKQRLDRVVSFFNRYFFEESKFIELYYFKRFKPAEIGRQLDLSTHNITRLKNKVVQRTAEILGVI